MKIIPNKCCASKREITKIQLYTKLNVYSLKETLYVEQEYQHFPIFIMKTSSQQMIYQLILQKLILSKQILQKY